MRKVRTAAATGLMSLALLGATAVPAAAQQNVDQDGLVNVNVGDVTILEDVNIGVAAQVAANICGVRVGPVAVLGQAVDRSGDTRTVCETDQGDVTISQN
jgi:hypothetical protein